MRVANTSTDNGSRLAVEHAGSWRLISAPDAPASVDELVRGGDAARQRVAQLAPSGEPVAEEALGLCIPSPQKILCIGLNYRRHAVEANMPLSPTPVIFAKFNNTLIASRQPVGLPTTGEAYDYEAELAVVIGRRAVNVSEESALDYVWGYCNCNDLTERELQNRTSQFILGKTLDGFLPVGPWLVTADEIGDPQQLPIRCWLNGELRQDSNTSDMVFSVREIISYISRYLPLEVGDIIATGTPGGVILGRDPKVWMKAGDVVDVEVGGLGRLTSPLVTAAW